MFRLRVVPGYGKRAKDQCLAWAEGKPEHNKVDDECCPDFSCCHPEMFDKDDVSRWAYYRKRYGEGARQ